MITKHMMVSARLNFILTFGIMSRILHSLIVIYFIGTGFVMLSVRYLYELKVRSALQPRRYGTI